VEALKSVISEGTLPSMTHKRTENHFLFSNNNAKAHSAGRRTRAFFLCPLTGKYEFYFTCDTSCEWFIKESERSSGDITGGSSHQPMNEEEYNS